MAVYENKYYIINVLDPNTDPDQCSYEIVSKLHNVMEHKTHTYPTAVNVANGLEAEIDKLRAVPPKVADVLSIKPH